jgi:hypothetical protein
LDENKSINSRRLLKFSHPNRTAKAEATSEIEEGVGGEKKVSVNAN